jgi:glycosyltransferase involved in cell wall biosynthesis
MRAQAESRLPLIAVIADFLEEKWPSMDLAAEQLVSHLSALGHVESRLYRPPLRATRRDRPARALERALGRFLQLPLELAVNRPEADYFHIADHSYGHLALLFPSNRVGVYCHDIDAYRALLPGSGAPRSRVLLSRLLLSGLRHARVVFHSTSSVRDEILRHDLVAASRLVQAPLGIAEEFLCVAPPPTAKRRYLLHVGACTPRKNIELLLHVFAAARQSVPGLELVQIGGPWTEAQRSYLEQQNLTSFIQQKRGISRRELAELYAGATAVLVPSLAEGFGIPVIEALACGAPVVASDIPVLREVGFEGVRFCSLTNVDEWKTAIEELCTTGERPSSATRDRIRQRYTWQAQAQTIARAYVAGGTPPSSHSSGA